MRSLTVAAAATAAGLNIGLFIDTGLSQPGAGSLDSAIVSAVSALFPDAGLKPPASPPSASPGIASHAVTGGS